MFYCINCISSPDFDCQSEVIRQRAHKEITDWKYVIEQNYIKQQCFVANILTLACHVYNHVVFSQFSLRELL